MSVDALHPHFELASLRMMLFLAFTFIFVFSMCVYSTEFGQGGCPDTLVLLCLRVWYRSTLHSVLVWLLGSLGGKHTPVSSKGSHAVGYCRSW